MKGKLLLGLALTSFISVNALALEIKNGKLLSHKVWTTGDIKVVPPKKFSKEDVLKLKDKLQIKNLTLHDFNTYTYSVILSNTGVAGERTQVTGYQFFQIKNNSDGTEIFHIFNSLCAQTSDKMTECSFYQDEIQLDAQGYAYSFEEATIAPIFNQEGTYLTEAGTNIARMEGDYFMPLSGASSAGFVNITLSAKK